jgi:hypothetical protein
MSGRYANRNGEVAPIKGCVSRSKLRTITRAKKPMIILEALDRFIGYNFSLEVQRLIHPLVLRHFIL